jgi:UMF1 family MFS transporter
MSTSPTGASIDEGAELAALATGVEKGDGEGGVYGKTGLAWAWFEWARNPYYILVVIYIFAPYFAGLIAADLLASGELADLSDEAAGAAARAQGQATIATVTKWAGVVAGLTAPFLGAAFDRGLKRKPFIAVFLSVIALMSWMLWFAVPGTEGGFSNLTIMFVLVTAYVSYTYSEVLHNSMLPDAAREGALPGVSGLGLSLGNASSTLLFIALVLLLFLPVEAGWPFDEPQFGLDPAMAEHVRIVGPLCALWLALMIAPSSCILKIQARGVHPSGRHFVMEPWGSSTRSSGRRSIGRRSNS